MVGGSFGIFNLFVGQQNSWEEREEQPLRVRGLKKGAYERLCGEEADPAGRWRQMPCTEQERGPSLDYSYSF